MSYGLWRCDLISAIIPSYNTAHTIEACLKSVQAQDFGETYETIVVDSSDDGSAQMVATKFPGVRLIHLSQQTPPGEARNIGVRHARGEILAFIDSDAVAEPDWLTNIHRVHQSGEDAVGGSIDIANPGSLIAWADYSVIFHGFASNDPKGYRRACPTCNISFGRRIFEQYGYFPKIRKVQDRLFTWTLVKGGERILFDPTIQVSHIHREKLGRFLHNQYLSGRGFVESRRIAPDLPAAFLLRHHLYLIIPFVRPVLILKDLLRRNWRLLPKYLLVLPIIALGQLWYVYGVWDCQHRTPEEAES